ncbi:fatty acid desaturase [Phytomonospora endophytica]|uniref:Fatty acid desaturase n=1 Tax=Phytomonospora endophytica TaxID=714109 RepID=A0A841FR66_9ACTN|nr:fatty acid desaturase [Phytomonospora endophytica]GIG68508.1 hypothetical protein Pen01_48030 [Phytomonospora endophytica]
MTVGRQVPDHRQPRPSDLMSVRALLITLIALAAGIGLVLADQPYLALPATVGVLGGLHAIIGR